jgi:hypothetical protein
MAFLFSGTVSAQGSFGVDFKQGANNDAPFNLGTIHWIGSILQSSNSEYAEGMSTLQRVIFLNMASMPNNRHVLEIKLEADKAGFHAYDFLTGWNQALKAAALISPSPLLMPDAQALNSSGLYDNTEPRSLRVCGSAIAADASDFCVAIHDGVSYIDLPVSGETNAATAFPDMVGDDPGATTQTRIANYEAHFGTRTVRVWATGLNQANAGDVNNRVEFEKYEAGYIFYLIKWESSAANADFEFGVHIAAGQDPLGFGIGYGVGRGASNINGGPYHVKLVDLVGSTDNLGDQDNQLQGSQIILFPHCNISGPTSICLGAGNQVYNGHPSNLDLTDNNTPPTFNWSFTANTSGASFVGVTNDSVVTVNPGGSTGSYTLRFIVTNPGGLADTCYITTAVNQTTCSITPGGSNGTCPGTVNTYTAPAGGGSTYVWTVTGNATLTSGQGTNQITVTDGTCGTYNVAVTFSANGCSASCNQTFSVVDVTPPTVTATGNSLTLGCNPSTATINGALGTASATDNCGTPTVTSTDGAVVTNGCSRSQTRSWTATDRCGNTATTSRTATWTVDVTAPTLTATGNSLTLGCNPSTATINGALGTASATDACGTPTITSTDGAVVTNGCARSQTRTWSAVDGCGNVATTARTATWTADVTAPKLTATGNALARR